MTLLWSWRQTMACDHDVRPWHQTVAWLSVDLTNVMLTVSQEDINFETNFMIGKSLRIDQTLYVLANKLWKRYPLVPFSVCTFAFMPVHLRPNVHCYYGNEIKWGQSGFTKNLWALFIQLFTTFVDQILSLQGRMEPKSLQIHIFWLPWQHFRTLVIFRSSPAQGPSPCQISSLYL